MSTNIKICIVSTMIALLPATIFANKHNISKNGKYSIGMRLGSAGTSKTENSIIAGCNTDKFLVDFGLSRVEATSSSGRKRSWISAHMHIGGRYKLDQNTYFDYGILGAHDINNINNTETRVEPYEYGTFIGLSWKPTNKLQMSMKISPYTFEKQYNREETNDYFTEGSISTSYIF